MLTLYRNKRKSNLNQMTINELYHCINCLKLDKSEIKGTGQKGRILKSDLINFLKVTIKDKYEIKEKLGQIALEVSGTKYYIDHSNFLTYHPGYTNLIFESIPNSEYYQITTLGWKGRSILNEKHHKSRKEFDRLIKSIIYLEIRELYIKIKQFCINHLVIDLIKYCALVYCDTLGDDLARNVIIV